MEIRRNGSKRYSVEVLLDSQRWCIELPAVIRHYSVADGAKISVVVRGRVIEVFTLAGKTISRHIEQDFGRAIVIVDGEPPFLLVRFAYTVLEECIVDKAVLT